MLGKRVASLDTPIPFTKALEDQYLPKRFETDLLTLAFILYKKYCSMNSIFYIFIFL
jgi:hypothetical protein